VESSSHAPAIAFHVVVASGGDRNPDDVLFVYQGTATGIDAKAQPTPLAGMNELAGVDASPLVIGR
jgi:hypothetical protein